MHGFGWAKNPIVKRMDTLSPEIPITLIYGSRSWVDNSAGELIKGSRPKSYVNLQVKMKKKKKRTISDKLLEKQKIANNYLQFVVR